MKTAVTLALSSLALCAAVPLQASGAAEPQAATAGHASIIGVWVQYMQDAENGEWFNGGTYRVAFHDHHFTMAIESDRGMSPGVGKSAGLSDVDFDGATWKFSSAWPEGRTGSFALKRISDDLFEGTASDGTNPPTRNLWQRTRAGSELDDAPSWEEKVRTITREMRKRTASNGDGATVWWLPTEWWQAQFETTFHALPERIRSEFLRWIKPYAVVAVVEVDPSKDGNGGERPVEKRYRSASDIRKGLTLQRGGDVDEPPLEEREVDPRFSGSVETLGRISLNLPDAAEKNVHFFFFHAASNSGAVRIDAHSNGQFTVTLDGRRVGWYLPVSSIVPGKRCPTCQESVSGAYRFCPWDGTKLPIPTAK